MDLATARPEHVPTPINLVADHFTENAFKMAFMAYRARERGGKQFTEEEMSKSSAISFAGESGPTDDARLDNVEPGSRNSSTFGTLVHFGVSRSAVWEFERYAE